MISNTTFTDWSHLVFRPKGALYTQNKTIFVSYTHTNVHTQLNVHTPVSPRLLYTPKVLCLLHILQVHFPSEPPSCSIAYLFYWNMYMTSVETISSLEWEPRKMHEKIVLYIRSHGFTPKSLGQIWQIDTYSFMVPLSDLNINMTNPFHKYSFMVPLIHLAINMTNIIYTDRQTDDTASWFPPEDTRTSIW